MFRGLEPRTWSEQLGEALRAGADDFLITPFDPDELRARLHVPSRMIALQAALAAAPVS
jgi:DNA-binding response OmpR family regulator